jgi:hypothetical protein
MNPWAATPRPSHTIPTNDDDVLLSDRNIRPFSGPCQTIRVLFPCPRMERCVSTVELRPSVGWMVDVIL